MLQEAKDLGYITVVVDDASNEAIRARLTDHATHLFPQLHAGMGSSRRQAFFYAFEMALRHNAECILWTEPEKFGIASQIEKIVQPIQEGDRDIIVPRRSQRSFDTWPEQQVFTERQANMAYMAAFGRKFDPMFGPVAFSLKMAHFFIAFNPRRYNVPDTYIQHFAPLVAERDGGARLDEVEVSIEYPPSQRREEEGRLWKVMEQKRREQCRTLSAAYSDLAKALNLKE